MSIIKQFQNLKQYFHLFIISRDLIFILPCIVEAQHSQKSAHLAVVNLWRAAGLKQPQPHRNLLSFLVRSLESLASTATGPSPGLRKGAKLSVDIFNGTSFQVLNLQTLIFHLRTDSLDVCFYHCLFRIRVIRLKSQN